MRDFRWGQMRNRPREGDDPNRNSGCACGYMSVMLRGVNIPSAERARNSIFILLACLLYVKERETGDIVYLPYRMNKKGLNERNGSSTGCLCRVANACSTT